MTHTIQLDGFTHYRFLSGLCISPCGQYAAYVVARMDIEDNDYKKALFLYDFTTQKKRQVTAEGIESFLGFNGNALLFSARRSKKECEAKEKTFVYELPLAGGEALCTYEFEFPVLKIEMLNDNRAAVLHSWYEDPFKDLESEKAKAARKDEQDYEVIEEIPFWMNGKGFTSRKRGRLFIYELDTMQGTPLTDAFTNVEQFDVNTQKTDILFTQTRYTDKMPVYNDLMITPIHVPQVRNISHTDCFTYATVRFIDDSILFTGSDGKKYGINQDADIYLTDKDGSNTRMISPADWDKSMWNSVGSDIRYGSGHQEAVYNSGYYFITTEDDSSYINCITEDGTIEKITHQKGAIDCFAVADGETGRKVVFIGLRGQELQELYQITADGAETVLTAHNADAAALPKIVPEEFWFQDGATKLHGFVLKPCRYDASKKYPAILSIHGGPKTVYGSVFYHELQFFAQAGYFVFYTNPRGADGMGRAFADIRGKYGTVDYTNLMALTDEVLHRYPAIDTQKIGVMGGSYGGFMTNWIIGHTNRFAAACSQRSISNWISKFGITDIGYYFNSDQNGGATPWCNQEFLWDKSPLKYAPTCKTPTLFIHSDEDYRCFEACAFQMFTALKYHGCEARLVLFHGENHDLSRSGKPKHRIRRLKEIFDWFEYYLKNSDSTSDLYLQRK